MPRRSKQLPSGDPKTAIGYLRVSTDRQANSLDAQRAAISAWAASNGAQVVAWCSDEGVSGAAPLDERRGLMEALDALRAHHAGVLIAQRHDRFARDVVAAAAIEALAKRSGARVVTADGLDSSDTPEGAMIRGVVAVFAQYERAVIRRRIVDVTAMKRRRGEALAGVRPYGFRAARNEQGVVMLVKDPLEQAAIRRMRTLRAEGKTLDQIAKALTGKYEPRGKRWHASSVLRALRADEQRAVSI